MEGLEGSGHRRKRMRRAAAQHAQHALTKPACTPNTTPACSTRLPLRTWVGAGVEEGQAPGDGGAAHSSHHAIQARLARQAHNQVAGGGGGGGNRGEERVVVVDGGQADGVGAGCHLFEHLGVGGGGVAAGVGGTDGWT